MPRNHLTVKRFTIAQIMMLSAYVAVLGALVPPLHTYLHSQKVVFPWYHAVALLLSFAGWVVICFRTWRQRNGSVRSL